VNQYYNNFFVENPSMLIQTLGTGVKESDADTQINNMVFSLSQIICTVDSFTKIKKCIWGREIMSYFSKMSFINGMRKIN